MHLSTISCSKNFKKYINNPYEVHRRLWMAFPDNCKQGKSDFFEQIAPTTTNLLFREVESRRLILVQSVLNPDWERAFKNSEFLLEQSPVVKTITHDHIVGERLSFAIRVNPCRRQGLPPDKRREGNKWIKGQKQPILEDEAILGWFGNKAEMNGFQASNLTVKKSHRATMKKYTGDKITLWCVDLEGTLTVTNSEKFNHALTSGVGSAKGMGFGLLLVRAEK